MALNKKIKSIPKPYRDMVCLRVCREEEKTVNGIILPVTNETQSRKGIVVSVGKGGADQPMSVCVGQCVWYGKYSGAMGVEFELDGETYILMHEENIYAIASDSGVPVPIHDMVVIQPVEHEDEITKSGIILPGTACGNKTNYGKIVAVGKGGKNKPMCVQVGETAIYTKFRSANGVEVFDGHNKYVICREREIYAVL